MNVKLNDNVLVITGKDAGKQGRVIATSPKHGKVVVEGVNIQKKAKKARKANEQSQIIEQPGAIDVSNVMVVCDACNKPVRHMPAKGRQGGRNQGSSQKAYPQARRKEGGGRRRLGRIRRTA